MNIGECFNEKPEQTMLTLEMVEKKNLDRALYATAESDNSQMFTYWKHTIDLGIPHFHSDRCLVNRVKKVPLFRSISTFTIGFLPLHVLQSDYRWILERDSNDCLPQSSDRLGCTFPKRLQNIRKKRNQVNLISYSVIFAQLLSQLALQRESLR